MQESKRADVDITRLRQNVASLDTEISNLEQEVKQTYERRNNVVQARQRAVFLKRAVRAFRS